MMFRYEYEVLIYVKNVYKNKGLFLLGKGYENMSDIARLRCQIIQEMEAMRYVFDGFAVGIARHEFIHARMQRIYDHQEHLAEYIGKSAAATIVCELYISTVEKPHPES
jgi:hypothetical protein